ncbi:MAG: methionyl-tRNA formyltransferase [Candidatus Adlerbacteria bacterium]|nr:methionyl-tRNA formyltransferase [Candidatus Adlerbacteria bacterium]
MKKPLFVFFGTPKFSVHVLDALEKHGMLPALVVTAPDRHQGRGLVLTPSPAKMWTTERGIDVLTPSTLKDETFVAELQNTDWDVFLVAAYAKLIPKNILDIPRRGCLNVHPSLLPKFRGPSPAASAILADERTTGVTIMQMAEKMDAGPVVAQAQVELEPNAWPPKGSEFEELLATEGGNLLAETIPFWIAGDITPEVQDEARATFTKKFTDADSLINLEGNAYQNLLKIRAFDKNPRAHFITPAGKRVIITEAEVVDGKLDILRVIPEGKKEIDYADFVRNNS